jgi:hypothetical protein
MPTQSPSTPVRNIGIAGAVVAGLCWLAMIGPLLFIVPKFEEIFAKFEIKGGLPATTEFVIAVSHVVRWAWPAVIVGVLVGVAGLVVLCVLARTSRPAIAAIVAGCVSVLALALYTAALVISLFLTLVSLVNVLPSSKS